MTVGGGKERALPSSFLRKELGRALRNTETLFHNQFSRFITPIKNKKSPSSIKRGGDFSIQTSFIYAEYSKKASQTSAICEAFLHGKEHITSGSPSCPYFTPGRYALYFPFSSALKRSSLLSILSLLLHGWAPAGFPRGFCRCCFYRDSPVMEGVVPRSGLQKRKSECFSLLNKYKIRF